MMKNLCKFWIQNEGFSLFLRRCNMEKNFDKGWRFYFQEKKTCHISFKKLFSNYECLDAVLKFISKEWGKRKIFFDDYELIYPRLITSLKWRFGHVLFERKKKNGKCSWKNVWKYSGGDPWNLHTKVLSVQDIPIKEWTYLFDHKGKKVGYCTMKKIHSTEKFSMLSAVVFPGIVRDINN